MDAVAAICRELTADRRDDGVLLAEFASSRSEDAFLELLRRHGPLVWGACRRLLPDPADAEDAFQAAFLVLVRQARRLGRTRELGPWLHRVAVLTARNVRRKNARRLARHTALPDQLPGPASDPDLKADIDSALLALPARYRESIILGHLQGFTRREAAERLGCPEGTLSAWLSRGLAKLRDRLRGLDPTKPLGVGAVAVPAALAASTARAAVASSIAGGVVPPAVSSLVVGVLHMLWVKKATAASFALCAVFALGVGVGLGTRAERTGAVAQEKAPEGTPPTPKADPAKPDPLDAELKIVEFHLERAREALKEVEERTMHNPLRAKPGDQIIAEALREKIKQLEAQKAALGAKAKADEPPAKPESAKQLAALNDLFGKPAELEEKIREAQIEVKRAQLIAITAEVDLQAVAQAGGPAQVQAAKATVEKAKADVEVARQQLQSLRQRLAAAKAVNAPRLKAVGACIEVVVIGGGEPWPCRVREYGREGKFIGSVVAEDGRALELVMTRAMKDPGGPRDLWFTVSSDQTPSAVVQAAEACKKAGYTKVSVNGTLPKGVELPLRTN